MDWFLRDRDCHERAKRRLFHKNIDIIFRKAVSLKVVHKVIE